MLRSAWSHRGALSISGQDEDEDGEDRLDKDGNESVDKIISPAILGISVRDVTWSED